MICNIEFQYYFKYKNDVNIFLNFLQMNTALQQQRLEVEQLRREAAMKRIPVSQAVEDIKVIFSYKSLYTFFNYTS